ncbi:MAG: Crp/Fnr family transcriptional regulator [Candidatus Thiodiazotropha sp.]
MERVIQYMRAFAPISDTGWSYFRDRLELRYISSGSTIHPAHEPCVELCFILKGVARSYLQYEDGRDITWFFHYDEDKASSQQFILMDYPSFNLLTPSTYGFQALTQCQVATIRRQDLINVFINFPEFLTVEKQLVINAYQQKNIRIQSLLTQSAKDRLEDFLETHSRLFELIPHYHIASFLGITPQRLCQLRRQYA